MSSEIFTFKTNQGMTPVNIYLKELSVEKKELFFPVFGSVENFYTTVYLIVRNQHIVEQEKPDQHEERLQVILHIKEKVIQILNTFNLKGEDIVADIASDYFEDFIQYKEPEILLTNEEFVSIIRRIQQS